jgi:hypothetical protein
VELFGNTDTHIDGHSNAGGSAYGYTGTGADRYPNSHAGRYANSCSTHGYVHTGADRYPNAIASVDTGFTIGFGDYSPRLKPGASGAERVNAYISASRSVGMVMVTVQINMIISPGHYFACRTKRDGVG